LARSGSRVRSRERPLRPRPRHRGGRPRLWPGLTGADVAEVLITLALDRSKGNAEEARRFLRRWDVRYSGAVLECGASAWLPTSHRVRRSRLWLDPIPAPLRDGAVEAVDDRDFGTFLGKAGNHHSLVLVRRNARIFLARGLYEEALLHAWSAARGNHASWPLSVIRSLFRRANPARFRALSDPLPGVGPFFVYRGVSGVGELRRERGVAWTSSHDLACWFALRYDFPEPTVLRTQVEAPQIMAYLDQGQFGRKEQEFLIALPRRVRPTVHTHERADLEAGKKRWRAD